MTKRPLSKTPRHHTHSRKLDFSVAMREKISENWIDIRKSVVGAVSATKKSKTRKLSVRKPKNKPKGRSEGKPKRKS